jgi:hypothetical protein
MLIHPLAERLRGLGMAAMADAFLEMQNNSTAADLAREDWLGLLLDREATARDNKRLGRRLSHARLRQSAVIEDTDSVRRAAWTVRCSTNSQAATGSAIASTC